jgi:hypothetical protein
MIARMAITPMTVTISVPEVALVLDCRISSIGLLVGSL